MHLPSKLTLQTCGLNNVRSCLWQSTENLKAVQELLSCSQDISSQHYNTSSWLCWILPMAPAAKECHEIKQLMHLQCIPWYTIPHSWPIFPTGSVAPAPHPILDLPGGSQGQAVQSGQVHNIHKTIGYCIQQFRTSTVRIPCLCWTFVMIFPCFIDCPLFSSGWGNNLQLPGVYNWTLHLMDFYCNI